MSAPFFGCNLTGCRKPSEGRSTIEIDVAHGYAVDAENDRFISRRHDQRVRTEGERLEEDLWMKTVKRYHERERQGILWERLRFHERMIQAHTATQEAIIARHRAEVERCEILLGINDSEARKGATAA